MELIETGQPPSIDTTAAGRSGKANHRVDEEMISEHPHRPDASNKYISQKQWDRVKVGIKGRWGEVTDDEYWTTEGDVEQLAQLIEGKFSYQCADVQYVLNYLADSETPEIPKTDATR